MASTDAVSGTGSNASFFASLNGASGTKTTSADEMQTRFLNLLVTQLKNQDPLNPMDNAQMTTQLSQISTVSGIEKLNSTLEKLLGAYAGTNTMQAAAMVGKTVLTAGSAISLGDYGAVGGVDLEARADKVTINITDAAGRAVRTQQLGALEAGAVNFVWDGKSDSGEDMPNGNYSFSVEATSGSEKVKAAALTAGMVNAVTLLKDGVQLQVGDNKSVNYTDIKQILN
jgi:flagellar basal-body rod modification protein FlgD